MGGKRGGKCDKGDWYAFLAPQLDTANFADDNKDQNKS